MEKKAILALGGNLGEPQKTFHEALKRLNLRAVFQTLKLSSIYTSRPLIKGQPDYLNMALLAQTRLTAEELLNELKVCEREFGREHTGIWQPRTLDIDIIDFNGEAINSPKLTIPHKEMEKRSFVIIPLLEILPEYIHPVSGKKITQLKMELQDDLDISVFI
ncbi:MAG: 2-amino-4-hydroxy-6-hydroxymethyldihydropteridine diphosphokinase [Deferribacteraceae bacterium]|jgi:2-amino-4-hydroxy-6-hydroxymethyldihydropteridine diphosphokinase|nr:2-amino-4-hydroxy-6-hydroxymethyldihydropteridine diphosphokinase [Deferribacteraceae bacterium]